MAKKPLWTLSNGITYSSLSTWMECPEQFSLQWIDGLTRKEVSEPLEFGSVFHYAIQYQEKGDPLEVVHTICNQYREHRLKKVISTKDRDKLENILSMVKIVFPEYCKFWAEDDSKLQWIGKEEKFSVPYEVATPQGPRPITINGMRDGLYRAKNTFGLFETKTKANIVDDVILNTLHMDMQTMLYIFATYLETGEFVNEIKYNVIRRPGLYKRKGEDTTAYYRRVTEDVVKRPEHYFKRYRASILTDDLENFVNKTLNPVLVLFIQWWDSVKKNPTGKGRFESEYHHLNSQALVGKFGKNRMWDAVYGNMSPYYVRQDIYPELSESFLVTWDHLESPNI